MHVGRGSTTPGNSHILYHFRPKRQLLCSPWLHLATESFIPRRRQLARGRAAGQHRTYVFVTDHSVENDVVVCNIND